MRITYSQRLLVALLNIDKYNNIVNNTKRMQINKKKRQHNNIVQDKTKNLFLALSLKGDYYR